MDFYHIKEDEYGQMKTLQRQIFEGKALEANFRKNDLVKGYTDEKGIYHAAPLEFLLKDENEEAIKIKNLLTKSGGDISDWRSVMKNDSLTPEQRRVIAQNLKE